LKQLGPLGIRAQVAIAVAILLVFRLPQSLDARDSPAVITRNQTLDGIVDALHRQNVKRDEPVFLTSTGYVSPNTLKYEFLKHGYALPRFYELPVATPDASGYPAAIHQAAFVLATEAGNDEVFYTAPWAFIQGETLAMA